MAYRFKVGERPERAVRRVARDRIAVAINAIEQPQDDVHEVVHEVRKQAKQLRSLLRLARPELGATYRRENVAIREMSRGLADLRDATSIIEGFDAMVTECGDRIDTDEFGEVRAQLKDRRDELAHAEDLPARLNAFADEMRALRNRTKRWKIRREGFDAYKSGIRDTYRNARDARRAVREGPSTETIHEWRKHVKHHRYHMMLVQEAWPAMLGARVNELHRLSDLLGGDHDLAVLHETLIASKVLKPRTRSALRKVIASRRAQLRRDAMPLGCRLFVDPSGRFTDRLAAWWRCGEQAKQ